MAAPVKKQYFARKRWIRVTNFHLQFHYREHQKTYSLLVNQWLIHQFFVKRQDGLPLWLYQLASVNKFWAKAASCLLIKKASRRILGGKLQFLCGKQCFLEEASCLTRRQASFFFPLWPVFCLEASCSFWKRQANILGEASWKRKQSMWISIACLFTTYSQNSRIFCGKNK